MSTYIPENLAGLKVLVVGLGRFGGGVGVARWLVEQGAQVTITDRARPETLSESVQTLQDLDISFDLGGHDPKHLDSTDLAIINPAVNKSRSSLFQAIAKRAIPWTTEINLFCERCPARVLAITGSYGKSTTATMLADALQAGSDNTNDRRIHLGGNIGVSLLPDLPSIRPTDEVVLELSSAQLEDLPRIDWAPPVAVLTNVHPHHLDRYHSYEQYIETKLNIIGRTAGAGTLIVGQLDDETQELLAKRVGDTNHTVIHADAQKGNDKVNVHGTHNQANAACAMAVIRHLDLSAESARKAISSFRGLPHRLECVRTLNGVTYINDSKSTAPANTITAIESCEGPIIAVVGGQDKQDDFSKCAASLASSCRMVLCAGDSAHRFARSVRNATGTSPHPTIQELPDLESAIRCAFEAANSGDIVLFSPGAPSFDRYVNFEQRGLAFVRAVENLR